MNPRLDAIPPSMIRELNAKKRPGDIDLGLGEPLLKPEAALLAEAADWVIAHGCRYGPNAGQADVREAVAAYFRYPGLESADSVCLTNGSQEAVFLAIKTLCDPARHEVLVVEPGYPLYRKIAQMEGIAARGVGMPAETGFGFDAEAIAAAVRPETRLVVLCSPCNPTGRIADRAVVEQLAARLLGLPEPPYLLVDEAYRELWHAQAPPSVPALYPRTVIAGSLSKSNALTGLRLGWLLAPAEVMKRALKVHQFVLTSANVLGQRIAHAIFTRGLLGDHRAHYMARKAVFCRAADRAGLRYVAPDGAFYAMIGLSGDWAARSVDAAHRLVDEYGVVTIPGVAFGETAQGWLRASFVAEPGLLEEGTARIAAFLRGEPGSRSTEVAIASGSRQDAGGPRRPEDVVQDACTPDADAGGPRQ